MAERVSARLSRAEARRFGLVVGSAFLGLGLLLWWRGRPLASQVCWIIGVALVLFAVVLPDALRPVYRVWMGLALAISKVTTPIFLGVVYFGVITPIGLLKRLFGRDTLASRPSPESSWVVRKAGQEQSGMTHQF